VFWGFDDSCGNTKDTLDTFLFGMIDRLSGRPLSKKVEE
jgi:hypothetical protein